MLIQKCETYQSFFRLESLHLFMYFGWFSFPPHIQLNTATWNLQRIMMLSDSLPVCSSIALRPVPLRVDRALILAIFEYRKRDNSEQSALLGAFVPTASVQCTTMQYSDSLTLRTCASTSNNMWTQCYVITDLLHFVSSLAVLRIKEQIILLFCPFSCRCSYPAPGDWGRERCKAPAKLWSINHCMASC